MAEWWADIVDLFEKSFIKDDRWEYIVDGLGNTLLITVCAVVVGIAIGFIVSIVRASYDKTGKMKIANAICRVYLSIIRGTPVVLQILIMYYVIFSTSNNKILIAIITFGINSGAYVAEIFRAGIMSVDNGQFEAGRSLGFNYRQTMVSIVMPQAFKNSIPPLANEVIVLLKETAIVGYIALQDLTKAADIIRSRTYEAFMPLIGVAIIYLVIVMILSKGVSLLERRLRKSDH